MITPEIIKAISDAGLIAYMRDPKDSWVYYTSQDGVQIGYLQADRGGYATISTVHKPLQGSGVGSGFRCDPIKTLAPEELAKAFAFAPPWVNGQDRRRVVKWKNWDQYVASSPFNAKYKRVN